MKCGRCKTTEPVYCAECVDEIRAALSPVRSDSLLAVLVEAKEEIEYVMENDRRNNPLYGGCPRQVRLVQKLQAEIKKAN